MIVSRDRNYKRRESFNDARLLDFKVIDCLNGEIEYGKGRQISGQFCRKSIELLAGWRAVIILLPVRSSSPLDRYKGKTFMFSLTMHMFPIAYLTLLSQSV
jgi:hypothetical protein